MKNAIRIFVTTCLLGDACVKYRSAMSCHPHCHFQIQLDSAEAEKRPAWREASVKPANWALGRLMESIDEEGAARSGSSAEAGR
jgi:hypothetical protein